jgi:hypothetical protein
MSLCRMEAISSPLSSRPERTRISYLTELPTTTYAALREESRTNSINATKFDRKAGGAEWRDLQFYRVVVDTMDRAEMTPLPSCTVMA